MPKKSGLLPLQERAQEVSTQPEPEREVLLLQRVASKKKSDPKLGRPKNVLIDAHNNPNASTPGGGDTSTGRAVSKPAKS